MNSWTDASKEKIVLSRGISIVFNEKLWDNEKVNDAYCVENMNFEILITFYGGFLYIFSIFNCFVLE